MMETFEPLIFYDIFDSIGLDGYKFKTLYFRFVSAAMFLLRGGPKLRFTGDGLEGEAVKIQIRKVNEKIQRHHRREFIADTKACCVMAQQLLGAFSLSPNNLHARFCMIPYLLDVCGHSKFEFCIERLESTYTLIVYLNVYCLSIFS